MEKEKQKRLSSGGNTKELEEAQKQVERLQSELKVRMKLNQLQATKVLLIGLTGLAMHYICISILVLFCADARAFVIDFNNRARNEKPTESRRLCV